MSDKPIDPVAQSVHDRLLKLATSRKEDFNAILVRYGNEQILYRLTRTRHCKRFVLKGASLFVLWLGNAKPCERFVVSLPGELLSIP